MNETMYLFALSAPDILEQLVEHVHFSTGWVPALTAALPLPSDIPAAATPAL